MDAPRTIEELVAAFDEAPAAVRAFLPDLPRLVTDDALQHGLSAAVAHAFHRLEVAHRRALYAGLVRIHGIPAVLARQTTQREHLSREHFHDLLREVMGAPLPAAAREHYDVAAGVRDDLLHGKDVSEASLRKALLALMRYAVALDRFCVEGDGGASPFAAGVESVEPAPGKALANDTARFVLRGMGFAAMS